MKEEQGKSVTITDEVIRDAIKALRDVSEGKGTAGHHEPTFYGHFRTPFGVVVVNGPLGKPEGNPNAIVWLFKQLGYEGDDRAST